MKSAQIHLLQMDSKDYVKKFKKAHAYIYQADDFVGLCETHEDALEAKQLLADQRSEHYYSRLVKLLQAFSFTEGFPSDGQLAISVTKTILSQNPSRQKPPLA